LSEYAVITQNDESAWDDIKGDLHHYPSTYRSILTTGCNIPYYSGKMRDMAYASRRLGPEPHYFGTGVVGKSIIAPHSNTKDRYPKHGNWPASWRVASCCVTHSGIFLFPLLKRQFLSLLFVFSLHFLAFENTSTTRGGVYDEYRHLEFAMEGKMGLGECPP
jgi:hypothetical protein